MMGFKQTFPLIACILGFLLSVKAQTEECSCAPTSYRFTLDFNSTCTEYNSTESLASTYCDTEVSGDADTSDLKPVSVSVITVVELDENSVGIAQQNITYSLKDGDSFGFFSSIADGNSTFPSVIQLNIYGENAAGDSIVNVIAISFTKNCSAYPVFEEDFSLGWVKFGELVPPPVGACTAYDESATAPPTIASASPSMAPAIQVTSGPTVAPAIVTPSPTVAPVIATDTTAPTAMPITAAPVPLPITTAPTLVMSLSMSMDIDLSMSMGTGFFEYSMLGMMGDLEDFGLPVPKAKDDKTVKAGTKKAKSGKKAKKSAKADASTKSDKKGGAVHSESKEAKKGKDKDGDRRRRLRLHQIVA